MIIESQTKNYYWTQHVREKLTYYRLSEQRVRRVMRNPMRTEEGVAPDTVAVMQAILKKGRTTQEIWAMYQDRGNDRIVITAWRYPGKSPVREAVPLPDEIKDELSNVLQEIRNGKI